MSIVEIEDRVRAFVVNTFLVDTPAAELRNTDDLFALLDSLQVLRLVLQIETLFGVKVEDGELSADNLGSVAKIAAFVAGKQGANTVSVTLACREGAA